MFNKAPKGEQITISFFGKTNVGKSSVLNAITAQNISIVSEIKGTTTDPVYKSMELLPLGSTKLVDTPGYNDESKLGKMRILKTMEILDKTDIAVLVCEADTELSDIDFEFINRLKERNTPFIVALNKSDKAKKRKQLEKNEIYISAKTGENIFELKNMLGNIILKKEKNTKLIGEFLNEDDIVVLVTPIDSSAPKSRIILPQQQTIRDILDTNAICVVAKETQLSQTLEILKGKIKLVVCDSQVFGYVNNLVPKEIPLTSFSILFARYKGFLDAALKGIKKLENLNNGDCILISEGCTHHRQCKDIGTKKLPKWISNHTKKDLSFEFSSGGYFPKDLSKYSLIVHCGGCMLTEKEFSNRIKSAETQNIPITNYGILIAQINGILKRSCEILEIKNK